MSVAKCVCARVLQFSTLFCTFDAIASWNPYRKMERGDLKIRVRSLENEKALERMSLNQGKMENLLVASLLLNMTGLATSRILRNAGLLGAVAFGLQAFMAGAKITKFDKTQLKYSQTKFVDD